MSRTDKTRPYRVQLADDAVARHDHRDGVCDLPPSRTDGWQPAGHCWWDGSAGFYSTNRCGCRLCTGHDGRREQRRRDRHDARRRTRRWDED